MLSHFSNGIYSPLSVSVARPGHPHPVYIYIIAVILIIIIIIIIIVIIITSDWQVAMTRGEARCVALVAGWQELSAANIHTQSSLTISVGDIYRRSIFLPFIDEIYDICRRHLSSINLQFSSVWDAERREKKYSSCLRGRDLWIILWYFAIYCRSIDYICWKSSYIIDKSHGATFIRCLPIAWTVGCFHQGKGWSKEPQTRGEVGRDKLRWWKHP